MQFSTPLDGLNSLVLALPVALAAVLLAPALLRDAWHHLTRKDLPK